MYRPRIKICGITRLEDALSAAHLGADALGLVFYAKSPRAVSIEQAAQIVNALPPFVTSVGLFVDAERAYVEQVLASVALDIVQFHGEETPAYCASFARPYLKAIRMKPDTDLHQAAQHFASARGLLLDTYVPGIPGGTGQVFEWAQIPTAVAKPLIVAGGLDTSNVGAAIASVRPWGVDVSGGVEARKGIKDALKMRDFIQACAVSPMA